MYAVCHKDFRALEVWAGEDELRSWTSKNGFGCATYGLGQGNHALGRMNMDWGNETTRLGILKMRLDGKKWAGEGERRFGE